VKLRFDLSDIGWWYWAASWFLIVAGMREWPPAFDILVLLAGWQVLHYAVWEKSLTSFPVQVRLAFLIFVMIALQVKTLFWIPVIGLIARTTVNYCFLARCVSLFPWNRKEPFTWSLVRRTIFTPPVGGSIVENRPEK